MTRSFPSAALAALMAFGAGCTQGSGEADPATSERAPALAIAHRGASAYAPEHTMAAYELALEQGADYIEPDLQVTKDGVLVAVHDLTLERTTNVREAFPDRFREEEERGARVRRWYVSDFTLEEIQTLDAGSWFAEEFAGERVPTFADVIALARGRAGLIPETKAPEVYNGLGFSMERLVLADLASFRLAEKDADMTTPVVIQSFSQESLEVLRLEIGSDLPSVFLISGPDAQQWLTAEGLARVAVFATGIGPTKRLLLDNPGAVALAHDAGLTVIPWTFGAEDSSGFAEAELEMAHFVFELGVDGLFTNNPDLFPRTPPGGGS